MRPDAPDAVLIVVTAGLLAWTGASLLFPAIHVAAIVPSYDLVFDTVGVLTTLGVAALAAIRYRQTHQAVQLYQASSFLVLAIPNAVHVTSLLMERDALSGMPLAEQGQGPIWAFTIARLGGALILVVGTAFYARGRRPRYPAAVVIAPVVVVAVAIAVADLDDGLLPRLAVAVSGADGAGQPTASTPLGLMLGGAAAGMFLLAAVLSRRRARRTGAVGHRFLALGLIIAAFSQVGAVIDPAYAGVVSAADVLRLAFYVVLLVGLLAETQAAIRDLEAANASLESLRRSDVQRAALEERNRLARELHDGVAQDLWFAKLQANRLAGLPDLEPEAAGLAHAVSTAIETGLEQSRQAVMTLRDGRHPSVGFNELLEDLADSFEDRFGVITRRSLTPAAPWLGARARAELLRIAQEAMSNIGEHADAAMAWLETEFDGDHFRMRIRDNGHGFEMDAVGGERFGIGGMRERAELIGAELRIESAAGDGTRVTVTVPRGDRLAWDDTE